MLRIKYLLPFLSIACAACEDQVQLEQANTTHTDVPSVVTMARGEGDILLVVHGAESVGAPDAVAQAARAAIDGHPGRLNPRYTLDSAAAGQRDSVVHLVLNGPEAMLGGAICRGEQAGSSRDEVLRAALAFCQGERALSWIKGRSPRVTSPDDPKFTELLQSAARELFPAPARD